MLLKAASAAGRRPIIILYSFSRCEGYSDSVHEDQAGNSSPRYSPVNFVWNPLGAIETVTASVTPLEKSLYSQGNTEFLGYYLQKLLVFLGNMYVSCALLGDQYEDYLLLLLYM